MEEPDSRTKLQALTRSFYGSNVGDGAADGGRNKAGRSTEIVRNRELGFHVRRDSTGQRCDSEPQLVARDWGWNFSRHPPPLTHYLRSNDLILNESSIKCSYNALSN